nr:beta-L-arabinofuranosidase domain-containing protein [Bradyrhizobium vignae]
MLYVGKRMAISVDGHALRLAISGSYPWRDEVEITVESVPPIAHTRALRLPEWCSAPETSSLNGELVNCEPRKGYLHIRRTWRQGDRVKLWLPMQVRRAYGHPQTRNLAGKVAIQRGSLIYCLEEADNGTELHNVWLHAESRFSVIEGTGLFRGNPSLASPSALAPAPLSNGVCSFDPEELRSAQGGRLPLESITFEVDLQNEPS